jgi:hypothetical protein
MNNPNESIMESLMDYMNQFDTPSQSLFLDEIESSEFTDYVGKTSGLLDNYEQLKTEEAPNDDMELALDEFYTKVPPEFSNERFDMTRWLESDATDAQEILNNYLDITDVCLMQ